jgi:hypothetical protein
MKIINLTPAGIELGTPFDGMTSVQKFNYAGFAYNDFADDLKQVVLVENVFILCLMFITKIQ